MSCVVVVVVVVLCGLVATAADGNGVVVVDANDVSWTKSLRIHGNTFPVGVEVSCVAAAAAAMVAVISRCACCRNCCKNWCANSSSSVPKSNNGPFVSLLLLVLLLFM